jgi:hypothetical protein
MILRFGLQKMKIKNVGVVTVLSIILSGCVGSGLHTSSLSIDELRMVDNYTLCVAFAPTGLYSPNAKVINEVVRREIDCSTIYQYQPNSSAKSLCIAAMLQKPTRTGNFAESMANTAICDQDPYAHLKPDQNKNKQNNNNQSSEDIQSLKRCLRDKIWC